MRKTFILFFGLVLSLAFVQFAFGAEFTDVPDTHWAFENIRFASEKGIVTGYPNGSFRPDGNVTREEASAMLYRAIAAAGMLKSETDFSLDYEELFEQNYIQEYARKPLAYHLKYGNINEAEIKDFSDAPSKGIAALRVQAAIWTAKAMNREFTGAYYVPYADKSDLLDGEMPYIDLLYRHGIMQGSLQSDGSTKFLRLDNIKRSEFAAIANRLYEALMSEKNAGGSGYYDIERESASFNNTLDSVLIDSRSEIIYNGLKIDDIDYYVDKDSIVTISAAALPDLEGHKGMQVHIDSESGLRSGLVSEVKALSANATLIGIASDDAMVYYLLTEGSRLPQGTVAFDFRDKEVNFICDGVMIAELAPLGESGENSAPLEDE